MDSRDNLERLMTFTLLDYGHQFIGRLNAMESKSQTQPHSVLLFTYDIGVQLILYIDIESTSELDYEGSGTLMGPNGPCSELIIPCWHGIDHHFVHEKVAVEALVTRFLLLSLQVVDVFNKALPKLSFQSFWLKLGVHKLPLPSLQGNVRKVLIWEECVNESTVGTGGICIAATKESVDMG
ncbi:hypothetical protein CK203_023462 [Vitis vinifera]|uniref:Uncharacterized protein n=1 Tax=Vitis vinifera TaxID=29760 RepID=A0A438J6E9_VITVI|nr:hypothetical protein CK203_023462 [Vitis vinifera]